jgi:raffinose/stachyose/melibiose transport system permease protein
MDRVLRDRRAIAVFVGPALLLYVAVLLIPVAWSVGYTFFEGSPITGFEFVGIANYLKLPFDRDFRGSLWFSARYAAVVTTGQVFFGLLLALLFHFHLKRTSPLVRTLVFFPVVLPAVATAQMFAKLFEIAPQYGLVNAMLDTVGLEALIQPWLGQASTAFWVVVTMDIWKAMGFYAVILYSGLVDIPDEILEAARLDGARGWSLVQFVVIPLLLPLLISSFIFSLNGTLKVFESVLSLTNGGPGQATTPLTLYMYRNAFQYNQYGYGSTVAVILTLICLGVTLLVYRFARTDAA